jgi:hypothetical protein
MTLTTSSAAKHLRSKDRVTRNGIEPWALHKGQRSLAMAAGSGVNVSQSVANEIGDFNVQRFRLVAVKWLVNNIIPLSQFEQPKFWEMIKFANLEAEEASWLSHPRVTRSSSVTPSSTAGTSAQQCLNEKDVPYTMTSDAGYADLIKPYNLRLPYKPAVVVLPITTQHVQDAVVCAAQSSLKVQAKSGGHSYASYSSGGKDGAMVVDLQSLQTISLDKSAGIATVGGGVRLGNLADGIWNQGMASVSHGTCPGVGIGGHYTHGGYSHTSRNYGLAMDQIIGADVVLANSTLFNTTSTSYPNIFWGIRGAADSLSLITTLYLQTRPASASVTYFKFSLANVWDSKSTFTNMFLHLQYVAKNASVVNNKSNPNFYAR